MKQADSSIPSGRYAEVRRDIHRPRTKGNDSADSGLDASNMVIGLLPAYRATTNKVNTTYCPTHGASKPRGRTRVMEFRFATAASPPA
jgi:hypothetical protein